MVDQLSKSGEEEAQLRKNALASRRKNHGTGDRDVLKESNPVTEKPGKNKDGVTKAGDEQKLAERLASAAKYH